MRYAPWARAAIEEGDGWPYLIAELAGFDPLRIREAEQTLTLLDIARAYAFRGVATPGVSYATPSTHRPSPHGQP